MVEFCSILKNSPTKVAFHPQPKGIIQFIGSFVFGSFPEPSYKYLFKDLYQQGYSLIIYRFPFNPLEFNHWSVATEMLLDLYKLRVEIISNKSEKITSEQLEFYANDANYFWLGHSLGCKYILLLEILSDNDTQRRDQVLQSCLKGKHLPQVNQDIAKADKARREAINNITKLLQKQCQLSPFIRDQPSLLLAPEINNTVQIFNQTVRPSSRLGFPNREQTQDLIENSTELFNLMGLISFNLDSIARDDVVFLESELQNREFKPLLHQVLWGGHFEPQAIHVENLVSCIDLILQDLRQRQSQGIV